DMKAVAVERRAVHLLTMAFEMSDEAAGTIPYPSYVVFSSRDYHRAVRTECRIPHVVAMLNIEELHSQRGVPHDHRSVPRSGDELGPIIAEGNALRIAGVFKADVLARGNGEDLHRPVP